MKQTVNPRLFTIDSAAQYLGVSRRTIEGYVQTGKLQTKRLPAVQDKDAYLRKTLIDRTVLDRFIEMGLNI